MPNLLQGQPVAHLIRRDVHRQVQHWRNEGLEPCIATLLVEGDPASIFYARSKQRAAARLGIEFKLISLPRDASEFEIIHLIQELNHDVSVHGIMLELPLPLHMNADKVIEAIDPKKDVDGLTATNRHANVAGTAGIYPATPTACVRLAQYYGYALAGHHITLVGCGKTVGMPLFHQLVRKHATVTACHVGTKDLRRHLLDTDLAFVAVGCKGLITPDMVHSNLTIIDAGINEAEDGGIVGDVAISTQELLAAYTPTPGGVGPVTTMQLFENLMQAILLQSNASDELSLSVLC